MLFSISYPVSRVKYGSKNSNMVQTNHKQQTTNTILQINNAEYLMLDSGKRLQIISLLCLHNNCWQMLQALL